MKQLVCEMCGSKDLIKQDGVFVCQSCGCKYTVEEARKMMVEGTVEVAGTVKVDNTGLIDSYIQMAENALEASNYNEAESYANRIIEIDPRSWRAWFIKGKASGWQTTGRNNRYPESIVNWINAHQFAPEDEKATLATKIQSEAMSISLAILQMECNSFVNYRSESNEKDVENALSLIKQKLEDLKDKTGIDAYTNAFKTILARTVHNGAISASNEADKEFGNENKYKTKHKWEQYTEAQDRCLSLLDSAYSLSNDDDLSYAICKNYITIAESVRDSCSYTFQTSAYSNGSYEKEYGFTSAAKESRTKTIDNWRNKKAFHDPDQRRKDYQDTLNKCEASILQVEESFGIQQYWEEHAEEKRTLESERSSLLNQIEVVKKNKAANPLYENKKKIETEISALRAERSSLGLFKGKEKKALQEKIDEKQVALAKLVESINTSEKQFDTQIRSLETRIDGINTEFSKPRGRISITHGNKPSIFVEGNKDLTISPVDLVHFLVEKLPKPYNLKTGTEGDIVNVSKEVFEALAKMNSLLALFGRAKQNNNKSDEWKDNPNEAKNYRLNIYNGSEKTKTMVLFSAKSLSAAIQESIAFRLISSFNSSDAAEYVRIVSTIVFDLFPSTSLSELQKVLAAGVYGITDTKVITSDGLKMEFERSSGSANVVTIRVSLE